MRIRNLMMRVLPLVLLVLALSVPAFAQFGRVDGQLFDHEGKPYPNATITLTHKESGQILETKTDSKGRFTMIGLRYGIWVVTCKIKDRYASDYEQEIRVSGTEQEKPLEINLKDVIAKQGAEKTEAMKKQEEERVKFEDMKKYFDTGRASLDQARLVRTELMRTPAAERAPLAEKLTQLSSSAVEQFQLAQRAAPANDPNVHIVMANLGDALDLAGRYDEAVTAYAKASELQPTIAAYYEKLGTALGHAGKVQEAMDTCDKGAKLPPAPGVDAATSAANCFGNIGIILQNASKMKESIPPLRRATEVNPSLADYWFLLGRGLANAMESKMEGGKIIAIVPPGTAEAYQKYLELAPTGRFAKDAQEGLETLKLLGVGIEAKVSTKKTKKP